MVATQILDRIFTFEFGEELVSISRIEGRLRVFRISRIPFENWNSSDNFDISIFLRERTFFPPQNNSLPLLVVAGNNECVKFAREIRKFVPSPRLFR